MRSSVAEVETTVIRCRGGESSADGDVLAVEEPLEIRVGTQRLVVLMRTPGDDIELAAGFLLTEGLIESPAQIGGIRPCLRERNVVRVRLAPGCRVTPPERRFYASSGCGVCGKASLDSVTLAAPRACGDLHVTRRALLSLPEALRGAQATFGTTGGVHAAGLFDADGRLVAAREDVGRHNAVDKVIGAEALRGRYPLRDRVLLVSSRASFEVCQKAAMAGISLVAAISAPSSLAVDLARRLGITLVGFLRGTSFNIYTGAERIEG